MIEVIIAVVTGFATVALACITGYYAWLTNKYVRLTKGILEENRQMRLDAQKPKIVIHPHQYRATVPARIHLCIENIGPGVAYDVQFKTDLNFRLDAWFTLEDIPIFNKGINLIKAGRIQELRNSPTGRRI